MLAEASEGRLRISESAIHHKGSAKAIYLQPPNLGGGSVEISNGAIS